VGFGRTALEARTSSGSSYAAPLQITCVGGDFSVSSAIFYFYHGTILEKAKERGKGFYAHPEETKRLALEWAKRRAKEKNTEWGIVRFPLTADEFGKTESSPLYYRDKFKSRPSNSPKLFNSQPATWIEFVEFKRSRSSASLRRLKPTFRPPHTIIHCRSRRRCETLGHRGRSRDSSSRKEIDISPGPEI
jgi:hypothetical protein